MFWVILAGILFIIAGVGAALAVSARRRVRAAEDSYDAREARGAARIWTAVGTGTGVLAVLTILFGSFNIVTATEVAVPVSMGKVGEPITTSGVHFTAPWTSLETYPTRPVTVEMAGDSKVVARTADAGQMTVEVASRWKVDPAKAKDLYLQVRTGDDQKISEDIVLKNVRQAVGEVFSATPNQTAMTDRAGVAAAITAKANAQLAKYGIVIEDTNLRSVEPDPKTAETLARFAQQEQATRIAQEAKKTAEIEAQRRLIEAQGIAAAAAAVAGVNSGQADILCQQAWERQQAAAIQGGQSLYTSPCGGSSSVSPVVGDTKAQ